MSSFMLASKAIITLHYSHLRTCLHPTCANLTFAVGLPFTINVILINIL